MFLWYNQKRSKVMCIYKLLRFGPSSCLLQNEWVPVTLSQTSSRSIVLFMFSKDRFPVRAGRNNLDVTWFGDIGTLQCESKALDVLKNNYNKISPLHIAWNVKLLIKATSQIVYNKKLTKACTMINAKITTEKCWNITFLQFKTFRQFFHYRSIRLWEAWQPEFISNMI